MSVLGFDPGQTGAIALVNASGQLLAVKDMPVVDGKVSARVLWLILNSFEEDFTLAVIEDVHAMPGQGVAGMFKFGRSKGIIEGVVGALGCPVEMPSPTLWKRDLKVGADKERSRALAIELWPDRAGWFARKKDSGRAEAALLAEWGRRLVVSRGLLDADVAS